MAPASKYTFKQANVEAAGALVEEMQNDGWTFVEEMSRPLMSNTFSVVMVLAFRRDP